jgi:UDP-GlcNAc:undecaprenyl-phosphate GlcNAc-1-phosphate transferase
MPVAAIFVAALVLGLVVIPLVIRLAWAVGYLDHPAARKLHTSATALLGGAGIVVAALLAWLATLPARGGPPPPRGAVFLLGGALVALLVGLWDDRHGMPPVVKLAGQGVAAALLLASGAIPNLHLGPAANATLTLVALVALMNAVNFLDNMNGMVAGLSAIALAAFAWGSAERGAGGAAAAQLALAGACAGFLPYNFPRARIFLGDAGSLFLGYSLGASAVLALAGGPHGWGQLGPLLALGYPVFDMIFVVVTRLRDGRKVYLGGKDHSNHRLARVLQCPTRTVLLLWLTGAALSASGLVVQSLNRPMPALLLSGLWSVLFLWAGMRLSSVPIEASPPPSTRS